MAHSILKRLNSVKTMTSLGFSIYFSQLALMGSTQGSKLAENATPFTLNGYYDLALNLNDLFAFNSNRIFFNLSTILLST